MKQVNNAVLHKPFVMLFLNVDMHSYIYNDLISERDSRMLGEIAENILDMQPEGKVSNQIKDRYLNADQDNWAWSIISTKTEIQRLMDYDTQRDLQMFMEDFYKDLSVDEQVRKYIDVFGPLVKKLHKLHIKKMELFSEVFDD